MLVYKFGGASVKDADSIRSLLPIIEKQKSEKLVFVISAMGKMTNAFEILLELYRKDDSDKQNQLNQIKSFHFNIIGELFENDHSVHEEINHCFDQLEAKLLQSAKESYDFSYDQTVGYGELLSSLILSEFINNCGTKNCRFDASEFLITNDKYRDAGVDWTRTKEKISVKLAEAFVNCNLVITQGFIGGTIEGLRTTIGREGSDYSAAIFAHCLNASELTVWKDVPGILNADPKLFANAKILKHISYHETIELAFYGASVIHPRTLQPLKAKQIPLYIRSYADPKIASLIDENSKSDGEIPSFIIKENQILFTIASRDFTFIDAEKLTQILKLFSIYHFHIRLIQNSALNFSLITDENPLQLEEILKQLQTDYIVKYNRNLSLLTVRHLLNDSVSKLFSDTEVLLEMHSRLTQQFVLHSGSFNDKMLTLNTIV
ncbi:MAG: aspartate kinase [Bacteroidales bacterium]|jgi:aspartate kinase|nr:aspartate kinase [Bacteroidales bacterium]